MKKVLPLVLPVVVLPLVALVAVEQELPVPLPPPLSPSRAVTAMAADLDGLAVEDAAFTRYLFDPYYGQGPLSLALRLHVNLISREATLAFPKLVVPGLWRVDLRDYQWSRRVFEKLADIDSYFHRHAVKEVVEIIETETTEDVGITDIYGKWHKTGTRVVPKKERRVKRVARNVLYAPLVAGQLAAAALLTQSDVPIVRADWFLVQGARQVSLANEQTGAGYYDWLELRNRDDYFRLIGEDTREKETVRLEQEIRAVVSTMAVSAQNRQVVRTQVIAGDHWTTLESFTQKARGIAIQELRRNEFLHDTERHYSHLANGLHVTFLSDAQGVRQDSVPDKVGSNCVPLNVGADKRVHVNIACIQCHQEKILQPVVDDVRPVYTGRLNVLSNDKNVALELKRQYGQDLDRFLDKDRKEYQYAYVQTTGKTVQETVVLYSTAFTDYAYARVTVDMAARELGVSAPKLIQALKDSATRLGRGDFRTDPFLHDPPFSIMRLTWEDAYSDTQDILYGVLRE